MTYPSRETDMEVVVQVTWGTLVVTAVTVAAHGKKNPDDCALSSLPSWMTKKKSWENFDEAVAAAYSVTGP